MSGRLIAVVGPSGAGKDSLIAGLATARPGLHVVRRAITRPPEPGGEPHLPLTEAEFRALEGRGAFCLSWRAHGLSYGIPRETLAVVAGGRDAVANLSRSVLTEAAAVFGRLCVLNVTASPETLARRLACRGRESEARIRARLARADLGLPEGLDVVEIGNDGPLAASVAQALAGLEAVRG